MKYAQWITDPDASIERAASPAPLTFRKEFEAGAGPVSATLTLTAMGIYTVSINGKQAEDYYFAPYFTDYRSRLQYQTLDVLPLLSECNVLEITVGAGWASGCYGPKGKPRRYEKRPALLAELCVTYADGSSMWISTDLSWKVTASGHYRFADWYDGETYDAALSGRDIEWTDAAAAKLRNMPELLPQYGQYVRAHEQYQPVNHFATQKGDTIYDFGQNIAGVIIAEMNTEKGQTVTFRHAEELFKGDLFTLPLGSAKQTATYICGGGHETYSPRLTLMGFRYVCVSGIAPEDLELSAVALYSDCPESGRFSCSDPNLEKLHSVIRRTATANMADILTDGPARDERLGRPGATALAAPSLAFLFDTSRFFDKWLTDLNSEQDRFGALPECIPSARSRHTLRSVTGDATVLVPWAEYLARGSKELLARQYPAIEKYLSSAVSYAKQHFLSTPEYIWSFPSQPGDIGAPGKTAREWKESSSLIATAYLANSCRIAALIAAVLEKGEDAEKYQTLFERISEAYLAYFTDGFGKLKNETQAGYALPLAFGMVAGDTAKAMARNLARLTEDDEAITAGPASAALVLFALADNGYAAEAYRLLLEYNRPSWLYEIEKGATTLWEYSDAITPEGHFNLSPERHASYSAADIDRLIFMNAGCGKTSFDHPAAMAVGDFLYRRVAGLEPVEGGYKRVLIKPIPGAGINSASASVESPYGTVSVSWRVERAYFILNTNLPEGVTAEIHLPDGTVTEAGSGAQEFKVIAPWRKYRITENENREIAQMIKDGLKQKEGYCPCRLQRTAENKCMCLEFRNQLKDPDFEGLCHCKLYKKTYEDFEGGYHG